MSSSIQPNRRNSMGEPPTMASRHDATLISSGPPAIYQLNTERKHVDGTEKTFRRFTYGRGDRNKQNKVILLVGETGSGKTTLINAMISYLLGVKFNDQEFYQITDDDGDDGTDETLTQTSEITVYEAFVEENPTSLTIIDTPGFGNTEGYEKDREISENLIKVFTDEDGIHYIDSVCFVMKASQNRMSDKELYIFHSVLSLFGKDIERNIVFLLTQSDGGPPTDALNAIKKAQIHCRRDAKKQPVHFLFNNQQKKKRDEHHKFCWKSIWEMTDESMNKLFILLEDNNRKSVQMTLDVLTERRALEACVLNLKQRNTNQELKMKELSETQEAIRQNRDKIQKCENFQFTVKKQFKEKVSTENEWRWNRNPTCCSVCEENCHERCWDFHPFVCAVMKNNQCTVCTGKCHYSEHVKENKKYVVVTKTVKMTFHALEQEYESTGKKPKINFDKLMYEHITKEHEININEFGVKTEMENNLKSYLEKNKAEMSRLLQETYMRIMSLSKIALKADSAFTLQYLDFLIPILKEEGKEEWVKNLEDLRKTGEEPKNKGALRHVKEFTEQKLKQFDTVASSTELRRRKSMDEPPEKIAEAVRLKDEFIDLYERDHPHLQQCTDRLCQSIENFENIYKRATEECRNVGWLGFVGAAIICAALASAPLVMGTLLFAVDIIVVIIGAMMVINARSMCGFFSSEKKEGMMQLRKDIKAQVKEFQNKINPMAEKLKELDEHTENLLRESEVIKMEDVTGLTDQMAETMRLNENLVAVDVRFSFVLDLISVIENNRVMEDMQSLAETPIHQETDEELQSKVGKFIAQMRRLIHQLQNVVYELEKTKEQLAVY